MKQVMTIVIMVVLAVALSLSSVTTETEHLSPTMVSAGNDSSVFWYNPDGGEYWHTTTSCQNIAPKYQASMKFAPMGDLNALPFRRLKPCPSCAGNP